MQEEINELFVPRANRFIKLLNEATQMQSQHIKQLKECQRELSRENKLLIAELKTGIKEARRGNDEFTMYRKMLENMTYCKDLEQYITSLQEAFQKYTKDLNIGLGTLSSHWGGYVEKLGVQFMLSMLKKDFGVHTSFQKFERLGDNKETVEIDLLAISDTHVYVVEVKSHLKEETFIQMLYILDKIRRKIPEYSHLKIQPVFVCAYARKAIVRSTILSGLWIVRYNNLNPDKPQKSFEWLRKDEE